MFILPNVYTFVEKYKLPTINGHITHNLKQIIRKHIIRKPIPILI